MASIIKTSLTRLKTALLLLLTTSLFSIASFAAENTAIIFRPAGDNFDQVVSGITDDLEEDINFNQVIIHKKNSTVKDITDAMKKFKPNVVILMGNKSLSLYASHQEKNPDMVQPPSVAVAALFIDRFLADIKNSTGIRYEIPLVTSVVNMRAVMQKPIKKVGVVYRQWMKNMIKENERYLNGEGVELFSVELPDKSKSMPDEVKRGLSKLMKNDVDAIWMLNDNELLNGATIGKAWLPSTMKEPIPVIVGIKNFVSNKLRLGSFAVVPDHYGLGAQTASVIGELMDSDWDLDGREIEQPLSVKKIANLTSMDKKGIKYRKDKLSLLDEVIDK